MIKDNKGQISLEYLLIFTVSLIILIVFTIPMAQYSIESTLDVYDSMNVKNDLSKISSSVKQVYSEGQGSKQLVIIQSSKSYSVKINNEKLTANLKLKDGKIKTVEVNCNSNLDYSSISVRKGINNIVVEWPVGSEMMIYNDF